MLTIIRAFVMYKPLKFFSILGGAVFGIGLIIAIRFLVFFLMGDGEGHAQSLILASTLMIIGFQTIVIGILGDVISANRKLLEEIRYKIQRLESGWNETQK